MSAKHTPGPWEIRRGYDTIIDSIGPCIPEEYAGSAWLKLSEADARLIAAAPELLAALKFIVSEWGYDGHGGELEDGESEVIDKARAAIAKATAQQ